MANRSGTGPSRLRQPLRGDSALAEQPTSAFFCLAGSKTAGLPNFIGDHKARVYIARHGPFSGEQHAHFGGRAGDFVLVRRLQ
ncbi:MAG: hypothetical protein CTY31_06200 [Hyphomicrobium sp.]|nr:MAG: hypothetical protein CTY31_06200 [Hyphomicrobium sp.]